MVRQRLGEILIDFQRIVLAAVARQKAAIGFHGAQRRRVGLVGAGVALAGVFLIVREIEDDPGMKILEDAVPIRAAELVQHFDRDARIPGAIERPCRQQRRRQVGHRAAHRLGKILPGRPIMPQLEFAYADHKTRDAVGVIDRKEPLGKFAGVVDVAIREHRKESAAEKIGVVRIELQHIEVIGCRGGGVALGSGMAGGQVAAGGIHGRELLLRRYLGGKGLGGKGLGGKNCRKAQG